MIMLEILSTIIMQIYQDKLYYYLKNSIELEIIFIFGVRIFIQCNHTIV